MGLFRALAAYPGMNAWLAHLAAGSDTVKINIKVICWGSPGLIDFYAIAYI